MITRSALCINTTQMTETPATPTRRRGRPGRAASRDDVLDIVAHGSPPRRAGRRPGDRGRARARPHDDLPLVRLARGPHRRDGRPGGGAALRRARSGREGRAAVRRSSTRSIASTGRSRQRLHCAASSSSNETGCASSRRVAACPSPGCRQDRGLHRGGGASPRATGPPVDPSTLAYAIVRLAEAFLFNDATAAMRGDVDRLREIEAALLGVRSRLRTGRCRRRAPRPRRARRRARRCRHPRCCGR